ncbi:MAG: hypothetical protein KUL78_03235 [Flavobacterium sp.]|nr:hypothetical protein [Flavobacterium sp.]
MKTFKTFAEYRKHAIEEMEKALSEMKEMGYTEEEINNVRDEWELPTTRTAMGY